MPRRENPITPVELEEQPATRSGLGSLVETTLVRFLQQVVNTTGETISEIIEWGLEILLEAVEEALIDVNTPMIRRVIANLPDDSPLLPYLRAMIESKSLAGVAALGGFAGTMGTSAAGALLTILLRPLGYELDSTMRTSRLDPSAAIAGMWRNVLSRPNMLDQLSDLGWSEGNIAVWEEILKPLISEADILTLWLREEITSTDARARLTKRGYDNSQINSMLAVMRPLTSPDDLRSMMFRDIISPTTFGQRLAEHGYTSSQVSELQELAWSLLSPGDIVELYRRGELTRTSATTRLKDHGYTEDAIVELLEVGRPLTGLGEVTELFWRKELSETEFRERVKQYGYDDRQVDEIITLTHRIPGPGDLISMAVREAFRPDLIEEYEYLAEFPPEFAEWMEKQGFDREWAERYWVAHWRLPSLTMAYDMFHRRIIDDEELDRLFAVSDIAPFWRPKLKQAAYRPLSRVDVRRMYGLGVLDEEGIYNAYLDIGYSPENADHMTEFTLKYEAGGEREATKADILSAYRAGILDHSEAEAYLIELGYLEEWAGYYLDLEDLKRAKVLLKQETDILQDQYIEGIVTRTDVFEVLGQWALPDRQIRNYLEQWDIIKERRVTTPSVGQLETFLKQDIIGEDDYKTLMAKRHYSSDVIDHFLADIRLQIAEIAIKEEERARKERERVDLTEVKTAYAVERADLDLQIAELKTAIAENKVLLGVIVDPELQEQITTQISDIKLQIVRLQEEKARAKLALTQELRGMRG